MDKHRKVNLYFFASCTIGLLLSCYALFVEIKKERHKEYKAYCDINDFISCTKAFSSKYGKGFGIIGPVMGEDSLLNQPNSLAGIFFYTILGCMCWSQKEIVVKLLIAFSIISNLFSLYLAFILYFILEDFCMVCVGTYFINAINLALCIVKWKDMKVSDVSNTDTIWEASNKNK